jgi:hypothetical protein
MTGNTLTLNPITGTNAFTNSAFGTPQQGFWGNVGGFGGNTPFGIGTPVFQTPVTTPINAYTPFVGQTIPQTGLINQPGFQWQGGFNTVPQVGFQAVSTTVPQGILNTVPQGILNTVPQGILNTILQTTPPQVLPFVLNALACQQACQQVLAQNPQAIHGINPQAITQPFLAAGMTNQGLVGFGVNPVGFGVNSIPFVGGQPQLLAQGVCAGCPSNLQPWGVNTFQGGFGLTQPVQPWVNPTFGTW